MTVHDLSKKEAFQLYRDDELTDEEAKDVFGDEFERAKNLKALDELVQKECEEEDSKDIDHGELLLDD